MPEASSVALSIDLVGRLTSPSLAAVRNETRQRLEATLSQLGPLDREILAMRHHEELTNAEAARELAISKAAASKRYIRALARLKRALARGSEEGA